MRYTSIYNRISVRHQMGLTRIVSGGQTGADRAALDAALGQSFPCGGWCPPGRRAEDGTLSAIYPVEELKTGGYRQRTIKNVQDSDGTAIFFFGQVTGGTKLTLAQCIRLHKPYQLIDGAEVSAERAGKVIEHFTELASVSTLNVAGPSEGRSPGTYAYVLAAIQSLVKACTVGA